MKNFASNNPEVSTTTGLRTMSLRYKNTRKCFTSKAAFMVLIWIFLVYLIYYFIGDLNFYPVNPFTFNLHLTNLNYPTALLYLVFPLAGLLADIKFGRYKTIIVSLWMLVAGAPFVLLGSALLVTISQFNSEYKVRITIASTGGLLAAIGLVLFICSFVAFNANIIQFGLDQLHDSPAEDQVIFIKWYVWIYNIAQLTFLFKLIFEQYIKGFSWLVYYYTVGPALTAIAILLIASLYISNRNKKWFFTNYRITNPYKLVYKVTRFACKHKTPVNRSAFTFCEDEIPLGLDLGKTKYGGPFTMEQVEDVKAFYGILRILVSMGPAFFLDYAINRESPSFKAHIYNMTIGYSLLQRIIETDSLYFLEVALLYPLYIIFVRPLISYYIPQTLYKIGLGMSVYILVLLAILGMDIVAHALNPNLKCMFATSEDNSSFSVSPPFLASSIYYIIIILQTAYALSGVVILTATYEFIFSQCPHAMKGFMMGLSFTISGANKALGFLFKLPFLFYSDSISSPSCGTVYYSANIVIGLVALMVFVYQVKRYKHRMRDEPCHVHRYVEEYYSKIMNNSASYIDNYN